MKKTTIITAILVLSSMFMPAASAEVGCATIDLDWSSGDPMLISTDADPGVRVSIVGTYVWVQFLSDGSADSWNNIQSVLAEGNKMTVCTNMVDPDYNIVTQTLTIVDRGSDIAVVVSDNIHVTELWIERNGFIIM